MCLSICYSCLILTREHSRTLVCSLNSHLSFVLLSLLAWKQKLFWMFILSLPILLSLCRARKHFRQPQKIEANGDSSSSSSKKNWVTLNENAAAAAAQRREILMFQDHLLFLLSFLEKKTSYCCKSETQKHTWNAKKCTGKRERGNKMYTEKTNPKN